MGAGSPSSQRVRSQPTAADSLGADDNAIRVGRPQMPSADPIRRRSKLNCIRPLRRPPHPTPVRRSDRRAAASGDQTVVVQGRVAWRWPRRVGSRAGCPGSLKDGTVRQCAAEWARVRRRVGGSPCPASGRSRLAELSAQPRTLAGVGQFATMRLSRAGVAQPAERLLPERSVTSPET